MAKEKKALSRGIVILIIIVVVLIIIGIIAGYLFYKPRSPQNFRNNPRPNNLSNVPNGQRQGNSSNMPPGNFQLNESQINEIKSFFESTTSVDEITNYCSTNPMNCMYYCREVNPNNEICSQLKPPTGGPQNNEIRNFNKN